jgi:hypothetical protein
MKEFYIYVKLTDGAMSGSDLFWDDVKEPEEWLVKMINLKKDPEGENYWITNLYDLGRAGFDLVSVTPRMYIDKDPGFKIVENVYIFKKIS